MWVYFLLTISVKEYTMITFTNLLTAGFILAMIFTTLDILLSKGLI